MEELHLNKSFQDVMLGTVEVFENILILVDKGDWMLTCENMLDVVGPFGINTDNLMRILPKIDASSKLKLENNILYIQRKHEKWHYTSKYDLLTTSIDGERKLKIDKLEALQEKQFETTLSKEIVQELRELTSEELNIKKTDNYYLSDEQETIIIPKVQGTSEVKSLNYYYSVEILQKILSGIAELENYTITIVKEGLLKMVVTNKDGVVFTVYMAKMIGEED